MRKYINHKLIIATLEAHKNQAFSAKELESITEIPFKTLKSQLKHLVHDGIIFRKTIEMQLWNKKKTEKYVKPQVWYYANGEAA